MHKRFPHLYIEPGVESEGRKSLTESWFSKAYGTDIEVVKPITAVQGVDNQFIRASRPNGSDRATWEDFGIEQEGDMKKC
jgi:hypothetical protein